MPREVQLSRIAGCKVIGLPTDQSLLVRFPSGWCGLVADSLIQGESEIDRRNTGVLGTLVIPTWKAADLKRQRDQERGVRAQVDTRSLRPRKRRRAA